MKRRQRVENVDLGEVNQANQPKKDSPKCTIQLLRPLDHCRHKTSLFGTLFLVSSWVFSVLTTKMVLIHSSVVFQSRDKTAISVFPPNGFNRYVSYLF